MLVHTWNRQPDLCCPWSPMKLRNGYLVEQVLQNEMKDHAETNDNAENFMTQNCKHINVGGGIVFEKYAFTWIWFVCSKQIVNTIIGKWSWYRLTNRLDHRPKLSHQCLSVCDKNVKVLSFLHLKDFDILPTFWSVDRRGGGAYDEYKVFRFTTLQLTSASCPLSVSPSSYVCTVGENRMWWLLLSL